MLNSAIKFSGSCTLRVATENHTLIWPPPTHAKCVNDASTQLAMEALTPSESASAIHPTTSIEERTPDKHDCMCNWSKCKLVQEKLLKVLPNGHPWWKKNIQFHLMPQNGKEPFEKQQALRNCITHHLHFSSRKAALTCYYIYPHHFLATELAQS